MRRDGHGLRRMQGLGKNVLPIYRVPESPRLLLIIVIGFAACMKVNGLSGPFRCKDELQEANDCLHN